ncbi:MAG: hypothetical protein JO154_04385 [Chitinophaga sp.]|uniref:hypothetical protein n=1 Tax=Chitinophaga sp. TaxID=1869181 RepID=UPI0025BD38FF|nr:hypothetical protein [Chitinophaga sp.]MBV8251825.1 hypothetical protein [Chitinophaga sp.]
MKRVLPLLLAMFAIVLFSCSKSEKTTTVAGDASWKFGDYTYVKGTSAQSSSANGSGSTITAMTVSTMGDGGNYGVFSGSALVITFYSNLGEGTYTLGSTEAMVSNPGLKIMNITCTIGTAVNTGAVLYDMTTANGTAEVTKDAKGNYHVSIKSAVTLTKKVIVGGGIASAKDTYALTVNNAN